MMARPVTASEKLARARTQLLLNQPFFGTLCLRLRLAAEPGLPTMATDGRRILYNPGFVEKLSAAELEGVLAHEVLHCALAHQCRRGKRDLGLWNVACDYAVNPILLDNGMTLPADSLLDPALRDLSAEEIYARLQQGAQDSSNDAQQSSGVSGAVSASDPGDQPGSENGAPQGGTGEASEVGARPGGFGEVLDAQGQDGGPASQAERSRQEHEWSIAAEQALRSAKACGRLPAGVERPLERARESRQDWRSVLRDFISAVDPSDYAWTPPNRRFVASGLYLPSVVRTGVGEIVIVVDTSGSIGSEELQQFAGEITAIASDARPERIHVVYADAAVQGVEEFEAGDDIALRPQGGGGTDFRPAFEWVEQQGLAPKCLLYLTDLCCTSYPDEPPYPVLWVTDSRGTAPFGETLRIELEG
jgi:predicted metal-dependent peptidase